MEFWTKAKDVIFTTNAKENGLKIMAKLIIAAIFNLAFEKYPPSLTPAN